MFSTVLFDIDGVMLSEERYFDASALTVYELLTSRDFMGLKVLGPNYHIEFTDHEIGEVRAQVFQNNEVLEKLKNVGVNANWDMVYLVFVAELLHVIEQTKLASQNVSAVQNICKDGWQRDTLQKMGTLIHSIQSDYVVQWDAYDHVYDGCTSRDELFQRAREGLSVLGTNGEQDRMLWDLCQHTFQEWYLGDEYSGQSAGKSGFLSNEIPLVDPTEFNRLLSDLKVQRMTIGVATGRPRTETEVPLKQFGWWSYFEESRVSTATDVLVAEQANPEARPLSKPHPYSYLRSYMASNDIEQLLQMVLPLEGIQENVLIVGDSIADALAAKSLGARFAAVLTGLEGQAARPKFESLGADFILDHALQVREIIFND